jgi:hypothetical protein
MYRMDKLADMQSLAPNNEIPVSMSAWENTSGNRKTQAVKSIDAIESFRPTLSTIKAEATDPGISVSRKTCKHRTST